MTSVSLDGSDIIANVSVLNSAFILAHSGNIAWLIAIQTTLAFSVAWLLQLAWTDWTLMLVLSVLKGILM